MANIPYTNEWKLTRTSLARVQSRTNENFKKGRHNLTDEKRVKATLKKVRALLSQVEFI